MTHQGFLEAQRRIATVDSSEPLDLAGLDLNDEDLLTLQTTFGALTSLTTLDLGGNQLSTLPESLGALTSLTDLYLTDNQLSTLPKGLGRLAELRTLVTTANPLPPEMVAAAAEGMDELLRFLMLIDAEGVELAEAKLVLVGEGAVGKTSLLATLRGEPWVDYRDQTHGLQIKQVDVTHAGQAITLNGWDFGGQPVYRPTHQLFFTAPAVYMVVEASRGTRAWHGRAVASHDPAPRRKRRSGTCCRHAWRRVLASLVDR